jgi:F0F1-type ATP synthase membrane subunit a
MEPLGPGVFMSNLLILSVNLAQGVTLTLRLLVNVIIGDLILVIVRSIDSGFFLVFFVGLYELAVYIIQIYVLCLLSGVYLRE